MLKLDIKVGESVRIGDYATITLENKTGKMARLAIQADKDVQISRSPQNNAAQIAARAGITGRT